MKLDVDQSLKGQVVKQLYAPGSKSEHDAVCLRDVRGRSYRLRLLGGEPFADPKLEELIGKSISVKGQIVHGNTMIIRQWAELKAR